MEANTLPPSEATRSCQAGLLLHNCDHCSSTTHHLPGSQQRKENHLENANIPGSKESLSVPWCLWGPSGVRPDSAPPCPPQALPPSGIHIFASQLHTHLTGRKVVTVLARDGQEKAIVNRDNHYSPHFQVGPGLLGLLSSGLRNTHAEASMPSPFPWDLVVDSGP